MSVVCFPVPAADAHFAGQKVRTGMLCAFVFRFKVTTVRNQPAY